MAAPENGPGAPTGSKYWLISDRLESAGVFVLDLAGLGRTVPVFSFREEAELFLALGGLGAGWRAAESEAGELLSLFFGPCADVENVVLDPLPAMLLDRTAGLMSLSLGRFMDRFLGVSGNGAAPDAG